jgi:hypothetical protein
VPSDSEDLAARLKRIAEITDRLTKTTADSMGARESGTLAKNKLNDARPLPDRSRQAAKRLK